MPKVTIDGKTYEVPEGTNVLEACTSNGVKLEHFCYHRYLPVAGNCRTCMVEIEGPRGPMLTIGCNTKVAEGMVVHTDTAPAVKAQKSALEFLLLDHPLDCPVCDKAGECKLQDNYMDFGRYEARRGVPRYFKGGKAVDLGEHIILDQERCILCTRCIRFVDEVPKSSELCITNRGHESVLTTFPGKRLNNPYSGNVTDVCPVGALTLKEFRFQQRVWFLKKTESVCDGCSRGCSVTAEHNKNRVWRFMPRENPDLNRVWICDEGRLGFKKNHENRLTQALVRRKPVTVAEALELISTKWKDLKGGEVAGLASPWASLEDNWMLKRLFEKRWDLRDLAGSHLGGQGTGDDILRLAEKYPNGEGLKLLGIPQDPGPVLKGMESGRLKALFLMENDLIELGGDRYQVALAKIPHVLLLSTHATAGTGMVPDLVPVRTHLEKDGTFLSAEGRLQRFRRAVDPENPDAPESSLFIAAFARKMGLEGFGFEDNPAVFNTMAKELPALKGLTFSGIPKNGVRLPGEYPAPPPFRNLRIDPNVVPRPSTTAQGSGQAAPATGGAA